MIKEKILITGGRGMVGSQAQFGVKLDRQELDILKPESIQRAIEFYKPKAILHLAAMVDMQGCEDNPAGAYKTNVIGTYNVAKACKDNKIKLAYFSSCAVFDGKKSSPYKENDLPNPLNVYGRTKWLGELVAKDIAPDALIVRTGWLFGGGNGIDKKFIYQFIQKMKNGTEVKATSNRFGSPTYVPDLLESVQKLINENATGTFHVVNSGPVSYFEAAKEIKKIGNFKSLIIPVKSFEIENPALKRGKIEALISSKVKLRSWKKALNDYIEKVLA